jgi:hypothetical protein
VLAGFGAALVAVALGAWLLAATVFKVKVKTAEGEVFIVLEIDQPGAEVFVDGGKVSVTVPGDNKPVEIKVEPGLHNLRIRKEGFEVVTTEVELKAGKSKPIKFRLEPVKVAASSPPPAEKPMPKTRRTDYDHLATGRWIPLLPSAQEFKRLIDEKAYVRNQPKYEDGVLVCRDSGGFSFRHVRGKDAIIRAQLKYRGRSRGNAGLSLRVVKNPTLKYWVAAYFNGGGDFGIGAGRAGVWKDLTVCKLAERYDDYFEFAFAAVGNRLTAYVNGRRILETSVDVLHDDGPMEVAVSSIGIDVAHFRNIEVQVLDKLAAPTPPAPPAPPMDDKGFVPLFNGKDLTGWKTHPDQPGGWTVEGGYLVGRSRNRSAAHHLFSEGGDYENFHLICTGVYNAQPEGEHALSRPCTIPAAGIRSALGHQ